MSGEPAIATDGRTALLDDLQLLSVSFRQLQRTRVALMNRVHAASRTERPIPEVILGAFAGMKTMEDQIARGLKRELRKHPLWPWLSEYPGLAGPLTARLIAIIADPWRFPGRVCARGHHLSAAYTGELCPYVEVEDGGEEALEDDIASAAVLDGGETGEKHAETERRSACLAPIGPIRPGTGVASLWHYCGLHVVDGRMPRPRRGVQADWHPQARVLLLGPNGLADQIIKHKAEPYYGFYVETKDRLLRERGDSSIGNDSATASLASGEGADWTPAPDRVPGALSRIHAHRIARVVAVKRFLGDLLIEWKRVEPLREQNPKGRVSVE
jgi:hypothetical protein